MTLTTRGPLWLASLALILLCESPAHALILGTAGNDPVSDRAWPVGALEVANRKSRIAWWEGPPFGGGEFHFEYRGDTAEFVATLEAFAKIKAPKLRLVVKDGSGQSFWLNPNRDPGKKAPMDWSFTVWDAERFHRLFNNPSTIFSSGSEHFRQDVPPPQLTLFAGGSVDWSQVKVPAGIEIDDQRLEAHGYQLSDGMVFEARVWDVATLRPVPTAEMIVESTELQAAGGYRYQELEKMSADEDGRIVLKGAPSGWIRVSVRADGYAPRIVAFASDEQPGWSRHDVRLARAVRVTGKVADEEAQPVARANVRISDVLGLDGKGYESQQELTAVTDEQGEFVIEQVPAGFGRFRAYGPDHTFQGLGVVQELNAAPQVVMVVRAGKLRVKVDFGTKKPEGDYLVEVAPEAGAAVGRWSGTASLGSDGTVVFDHMPPGRYTAYGRPNHGSASEQTESVTTEVKPLEQAEIDLKAK